MIFKVKWTKQSAKSFDKTIEYIQLEWSENVADKFILKVNKFISLIEKQPKIGKLEIEEKGIRGFVLSRHTTVLYRIKENKIILLNFFDNRQSPKKKNL